MSMSIRFSRVLVLVLIPVRAGLVAIGRQLLELDAGLFATARAPGLGGAVEAARESKNGMHVSKNGMYVEVVRGSKTGSQAAQEFASTPCAQT